MKYYLIMFLMLWATSVLAVETRSKPVQCGAMAGLLEILNLAEEKALLGGLSQVRLNDGSTQILPVYVFANTNDGTFTFIEMHPESNEACVLGFGDGLDFDVQQYFEPKTNS